MTPFETFLTQLAPLLDFKTLTPDAHGACLILMKESQIPLLFEFDLQLVPNTVLLSTPVAPIPLAYRATIYEAALKGNQGIEATLSVKPDEDLLYLHQRLHPTIQTAALEKVLEVFLQTVTQWRQKIETLQQAPPHAEKLNPSLLGLFPYKA